MSGALLLVMGSFLGSPAMGQTYLAFGDSITEGFGDSVPLGLDSGYPSRLSSLLGNTVLNRGLSGEKTPDGLSRLDQVLAVDSADVLLLMEGTNDVTGRRSGRSDAISQETTLFNLEEMARKAASAGLSVVYATTIPRWPSANKDADNIDTQSQNQSIRNLAGSQGRQLADPFEVFSTQSSVFTRLYYQPGEGEEQDPVGHPNAAGYDLMAGIFADVVTNNDSVPPVPGLLSPNRGDEEVPASAAIRVEIWDFGSGIDLSSLSLLVNGQTVSTSPSGSSVNAVINYVPPAPLSGTVAVSLTAQDLAIPANTFNRQISTFDVVGSSGGGGFQGDIDSSGRVDGFDLLALALAFGSDPFSSRWNEAADFDNNSVIDGSDLAVLGSNFGQTATP